MHSINRTLAVAGLVAVAVAGGCKKEPAEGAAGPGGGAGGAGGMPAPAVVVAQAVTRDVPVYIDRIGTAMPTESVTIMPRIAGQVVARKFEDGADLTKDQVLFEIDPAPARATLAAAKAALQQSKAAADLAKIELDRYSAVAGTNAISKSDFDTKKNAVDVAAAMQAAAEAAVQSAQINVDFTTIRSPLNGRAGARMVDAGNVVKENETAMLSVQSIDPIYADFTVNQQELADVRANMANGTLVTLAKLPGDKGEGRAGELTFLDNSVQTGTGTIKLRATMKNADRHFWPGQFVDVRLVLKTLKDAVLVPTSAQQLSQSGPYVVVVKSDNTAEMRPIVAGQQQGDMVVIAKGVAAGENVITDGTLMVRPGGPVRIVPAGNGGAATQQAGVPQKSGPEQAGNPPQADGDKPTPVQGQRDAGSPTPNNAPVKKQGGDAQ